MDKLLRLGWWHRREACQPLELPLSHPFEFDFERQVYSGKNNINRAPSSERRERREETKVDVPRSNLSLARIFFSDSSENGFLSLFYDSFLIFFFIFLSLLSKFEKLFLFFFYKYSIGLEIWEKSKRGMIRSVVKRRMKNLLSLLKSNKRWQATRQSFYPSPVYKILTNVPNPDWIEPSTARSSTESVYRIQTSIPLEKFIFESDEPIKDSRVSRHFFESETPPFAQFPRLNENKKKREKEKQMKKKQKFDTKQSDETRLFTPIIFEFLPLKRQSWSPESSRSFRDRPKKRMARAEGWQGRRRRNNEGCFELRKGKEGGGGGGGVVMAAKFLQRPDAI